MFCVVFSTGEADRSSKFVAMDPAFDASPNQVFNHENDLRVRDALDGINDRSSLVPGRKMKADIWQANDTRLVINERTGYVRVKDSRPS